MGKLQQKASFSPMAAPRCVPAFQGAMRAFGESFLARPAHSVASVLCAPWRDCHSGGVSTVCRPDPVQRASCFGGVGGWDLWCVWNLVSPVTLGLIPGCFLSKAFDQVKDVSSVCVCVCAPSVFVCVSARRHCLISHSSSGLPQRKTPSSSVVLELRFLGLKLGARQPASYGNVPKGIGLRLSGMKAGRQAWPVTATSWTAPAGSGRVPPRGRRLPVFRAGQVGRWGVGPAGWRFPWLHVSRHSLNGRPCASVSIFSMLSG